MDTNRGRSIGVGLAALVALGLLVSQPVSASVCFTSGKVYMQQKVYDKAAYFLECARKGEPENIDALSLLAVARAEQRQFVSSGAAFQLALNVANKKKDQKKVQDLERNRLFYSANLFNAGVKALSGGATAGDVPSDSSAVKSFTGAPEPQAGVIDTTVFAPYTGPSKLELAAYNFELASYVDPTSVETYQNLAFVYGALNRTDDAIRAAKRGLAVKPDDEKLHRNLRAAVMGKAVKLYNDGKYVESIAEFKGAMQQDPDPKAAPGYQLRIAEAWLKHAEESTKGSPEQKAAYDSAAIGFAGVLDQPAASDSLKENAMYNAIVIYANQENYPKAIAMFDKAGAAFPNSHEIWSVGGQTKLQAKDYPGAVTALKHALQLDPTDASDHQAMFLALNQTGDKKNSVGEYTIYKALSAGSKKTNVKMWVDSADPRLGAQNQCKTVVKSDGYPEEVYTYMEENKTFETWFFWSKGKSVTFLEGQIFAQGAFPPKKSS